MTLPRHFDVSRTLHCMPQEQDIILELPLRAVDHHRGLPQIGLRRLEHLTARWLDPKPLGAQSLLEKCQLPN